MGSLLAGRYVNDAGLNTVLELVLNCFVAGVSIGLIGLLTAERG